MRTRAEAPAVVLICHEGERLDRDGLALWLASTMKLAGLLIIRDGTGRRWRAVRRERRRVGLWGLLDALAFRAIARVVHGRRDREWEKEQLDRLRSQYPADLSQVPALTVSSPNSAEARAFLKSVQPDLAIARCKVLLDREIYRIPRTGTFVLHPGICPEYRNAHGCFWARAAGDDQNIGMTLLRIDKGVDTGPVYGYFRVSADAAESHVVTQHRVVLDHLDAIRDKLLEIEAGSAEPIETAGRRSATWGQPWLSAYLRSRKSEVRSLKSEKSGASPLQAFQTSDFRLQTYKRQS